MSNDFETHPAGTVARLEKALRAISFSRPRNTEGIYSYADRIRTIAREALKGESA